MFGLVADTESCCISGSYLVFISVGWKVIVRIGVRTMWL